MKKLLTKLTSLALLLSAPFFAGQAVAQGTEGSGAIIKVTIDGTSTEFYAGACGYGTATWGGTITTTLCAPIEWAKDVTPDSLCCDPIPAGSLTGKIALIRRGDCNFSLKALNAQNAGAVCVFVANNFATAAHNDCTVMAMGDGGEGAQITVPVFFLSRTMADLIDGALASGANLEVCIGRPSVQIASYFFPVSSKRTPESQIAIDTFGFGLSLTNTTGNPVTDIEATAYVLDASDNVLFTASLDIDEIDETVTDSFFVIPGSYAPELPIGTYKIRYTVALGNPNLTGDRGETNFYVTEKLFAKDDGATTGFRPGSIGDAWGVANLYTLSPDNLENYMVNTIEFAFTTNAADLPVEDVVTDLYFFKVNDDVAANYSNFEGADFISPSFEWLGIALYEAPTGLAGFTDQQVQILDLLSGTPGIALQNGARYVIAAEYTGTSKNAFHAFDQDAPHPGVSTLIYNGQWFLGGFQGGPSALLRMYLDLVNTTDEKALPETAMQVRPNPIFETLNLQMGFDQATDATITIAEMSGRVITFENRKGLTNDLVSYQVPQLATGTYLVRIATKAGTLTKKFVVQK